MAAVTSPALPHADHLALVRRRLHARFDGTCGPAAVDRAVEEATDRLADAAVDAFVPLLVERSARAHLTAAGQKRSSPR